MASSTAPKMLQQAEKIILQPIHPHLIACCPTMDLIAVVTEEENLDVYRINGQRAFGMRRKNPSSSMDCICWKFNGQSIAVAWSDGLVDVLSAETGKFLVKDMPLPSSAPQNSRIGCVGWGVNFINVAAVKARTGVPQRKKNDASGEDGVANLNLITTTDEWDAFKDDTTVEDFLQRQPDLQTLDMAPDLPNQLAMMDIEALMPKLPPIPLPPATPFSRPIQTDSGAFNSQAQVDAIFHSHHLKDHNAVDTLLRCMDNGTVNPTIYDSLRIVNVHLPREWSIQSYEPLVHANHPYSCSHELLMKITENAPGQAKSSTRLALVPLTLKFIPSAGIYLHMIASKTTQLQNLLDYIQICLQRIRTFWNQSQDLPSKFIRNVSETLEEKEQADLVTSLYHTACTGACPPTIKEWLVDELTDSGHKRWDHAVTTNLSQVITLTHENLLPAIDHASIVLSRLRGLAAYDESGAIFEVPVQDLTNILEVLKCLRLLSQTALLCAGESKRDFSMFSRWLRYVIDLESTTAGTQSREDMENRDPGVEYGALLGYIQHSLMRSGLTPFLKLEKDFPEDRRGKPSIGYDATKKALEWLKQGATFNEEALCLDHVNSHLETLCGALLQQFSSWQASSTSMNCGIVLEEAEVSDAMDVRMVYETLGGTDDITTYIGVVMKETMNQVHLHLITHAPILDRIPSSIHTLSITTLDFSPSSQILGLKFADDASLLILLRATPTRSYILSIPYNPHSPPLKAPLSHFPSPSPLPYTPIPNPKLPSVALPSGTPVPSSARTKVPFVSPEQLNPYIRHVFDTESEDKFQPMRLFVNGRKGRRIVVVLGEDRRHYRVLDMDFMEKGTRKEGGGSEESSSGSDVDMED